MSSIDVEGVSSFRAADHEVLTIACDGVEGSPTGKYYATIMIAHSDLKSSDPFHIISVFADKLHSAFAAFASATNMQISMKEKE